MALSNAERQQRYRARKRGEGRLQLLLYVTSEQAEYIRAYLHGGILLVTSNARLPARPAVTSNGAVTPWLKPGKGRRRKKPEDPREAPVKARLGDIQRWAGKGMKPTEIAKRLRIESVTGAYLNGLLGNEPWWPTRRR